MGGRKKEGRGQLTVPNPRPFQVVGIALTLGTADWGTDKGVRTGCSLTMPVGLSQPDWPRQNAEAQKHRSARVKEVLKHPAHAGVA